jgi:hypothetical protein
MSMIAQERTKTTLADLLAAGYTIRRGLYIPRRGFPRGTRQLFNPDGEYVRNVKYDVYMKARKAGAVVGPLTLGVTIRQEATRGNGND